MLSLKDQKSYNPVYIAVENGPKQKLEIVNAHTVNGSVYMCEESKCVFSYLYNLIYF